jgi:hypothetical protein
VQRKLVVVTVRTGLTSTLEAEFWDPCGLLLLQASHHMFEQRDAEEEKEKCCEYCWQTLISARPMIFPGVGQLGETGFILESRQMGSHQ